MGSINAIVFSCGSVALYRTGVDVQRWLAGSPPKRGRAIQTPPSLLLSCQTAPPSLANWTAGTNWMENHSGQAFLQNDRVPISGREEEGLGAEDAGPSGEPGQSQRASASWQTHNKHLRPRDDSQARMNKTMEGNKKNEQIITSTYMQGEVTYIEKNGTLQSILLLLVSHCI